MVSPLIGQAAEPVDVLAGNLAGQFPKNKTIRIAILNFPYVDGTEDEGANIVRERLTTAMSKSKTFQVLERALISKVLEQKKLEKSGLFNESQTVEIGQMLGAEAVLTGTLIELGADKVEINARIIDVKSGGITAAFKVNQPITWSRMGRVPRPIFVPAPVPEIKDVAAPSVEVVNDARYTDLEFMEKYNEVIQLDKSEYRPYDSTNAPSEKAKKWRDFAKLYPKYKKEAKKRAKEWERYAEEWEKRKVLVAERNRIAKEDFEKLLRYLKLDIVSREQKMEWIQKFLDNYSFGSPEAVWFDEQNIFLGDHFSEYIVLAKRSGRKMTHDEALRYCKGLGGWIPSYRMFGKCIPKDIPGEYSNASEFPVWEHEGYLTIRPTDNCWMSPTWSRSKSRTDRNYAWCIKLK
jgi:TolB-like protein